MIYELTDFDSAGCAQTDEDRVRRTPLVPCAVEPEKHGRLGGQLIGDLFVKLPSYRIDDYIQSWQCDHLVTQRVADVFKENGITGYELLPVHVTGHQRGRKPKSPPPRLWKLKAAGWGGVAPKASGMKLLWRCDGCDAFQYSSYTDASKLFDEKQWDGSDIFMIWPLVNYVFVTERVRELALEHGLKSMRFLAINDMVNPNAEFGFGAEPLHYYMNAKRAKKLGGALGID